MMKKEQERKEKRDKILGKGGDNLDVAVIPV
jgi:hypothetical protein